MNLAVRLALLGGLILMTGCGGAGSLPTLVPTLGIPGGEVSTAAPTLAPPAVKTLLPLPTETVGAEQAYPVAPETAAAYPYPAAQGELQPAGADQPSAFSDCSRTPGLVGCDPQAVPIAANLAVFDRQAGRLVVIDLTVGTGWQIPAASGGLEWSPGGEKLLVWRVSEGGRKPAVWSAAGELLETPASDQVLRWQATGDLAPLNLLAYPDGSRYRLELVDGSRWNLQIRRPGQPEVARTIDPAPADRQYLLVERFPDSDLLIQTYFPTNLGMSGGGDLLRYDFQTARLTPLEAGAPLLEKARFTVSPVSPAGLLAFSAAGGEPGLTRLALYDPAAGKLRYPLPEGVQSSMQDWHPREERLAAAAAPLFEPTADIPGAGLYQVDPGSGAMGLLVATPPGGQDGYARWSADGQALIFARLITDAKGDTVVEVRAWLVEQEREVVLFSAIPALTGPRAGPNWDAILAVGK